MSDPFLQMQYEYQIGAPRLPAIRTHALYTGATHFPSRSDEVLVLDRPHESVLMCLLRRSMAELTGAALESSRPDDWPTAEARRHPTSGFRGRHWVLGFLLMWSRVVRGLFRGSASECVRRQTVSEVATCFDDARQIVYT